MASGGYQFFDPQQAATIAAAVARLFPADDLGPGAVEIGVVVYIDRALAGYDASLQQTYQRGTDRLDREAHARSGQPFRQCTAEVQDEILATIERVEGDEPRSPWSHPFFETLLAHTREGLFSDPSYGGNRELTGWKLLGYPGVQLAYPPEDFAPGAQISRQNVYSLADVGTSLIPGWMRALETTDKPESALGAPAQPGQPRTPTESPERHHG